MPSYSSPGNGSVYRQSDDPTTISTGDIWVDTDNGVIATWNGSAWVPQTGGALGTARQALLMNAAATALSYSTSPQSLMTGTGDILQSSSANTPARLAIGTARQMLQVNSGATALEYAASPQSLMTGTGDLIYSSGANTPARLAIGSAGQALTVSGGVPAWGNAGAVSNVDGVILGAENDTIEVTSISPTYDNYIVCATLITTGSTQLTIRFNADAGASQYHSDYTQDGTNSAQTTTSILCGGAGTVARTSLIDFVRNSIATQRKAVYGFTTSGDLTDSWFSGNWINVVDLISQISLVNASTGGWSANSELAVWGYNDRA